MKKATVGVISLLAGFIGGIVTIAGLAEKEIKKERQKGKQSLDNIGQAVDRMTQLANKHLDLFLLMNKWVDVKQNGKNFESYFDENGYKRIAIYGMSYVGKTLVEELRGTDIEIVYGIDKRADVLVGDISIFTMEDILEEVDVIIVTAITFFDEIANELSRKVKCPIVSLDEVLREVRGIQHE